MYDYGQFRRNNAFGRLVLLGLLATMGVGPRDDIERQAENALGGLVDQLANQWIKANPR